MQVECCVAIASGVLDNPHLRKVTAVRSRENNNGFWSACACTPSVSVQVCRRMRDKKWHSGTNLACQTLALLHPSGSTCKPEAAAFCLETCCKAHLFVLAAAHRACNLPRSPCLQLVPFLLILLPSKAPHWLVIVQRKSGRLSVICVKNNVIDVNKRV